MNRLVIDKPGSEPITLGQAKQHLRVETTDEDAIISMMIKVAREQIEAATGRFLMRQTIDLQFDCFDNPMRLVAPLVSVTSVKYIDTAGALQTVAGTTYVVVAPTVRPEPRGFIHLALNKDWPTIAEIANAVTVRCVVGASDPSEVPAALRHAMLLIIADLYENRASQTPEQMRLVENRAATSLLGPWIVSWF